MRFIKRCSLASVFVLAFSLSCDSHIGKRWFGSADDDGKVRRNFILFVADGLRPGSVTAETAPTLASLRDRGVSFVNSHSLFPTFTTANASALATGHYLGDTGDFSNTVYVGYQVFSSGAFAKKPAGTMVPFLENDPVLADVDAHFGGNYLTEESLLAYARRAGYQTAAVGKIGPVLIQDPTESSQLSQGLGPKATVVIDDATGSADGVPLSDVMKQRLNAAKLGVVAPSRDNGLAKTQGDNGFSGDNEKPGTTAANTRQQSFFIDAVSKVLLPLFAESPAPFGLVYWSRDPDGSQHNQGDSLGQLSPGINGPTSRAAVTNVDNNLKQILTYLDQHPDVAARTDLFITSDHGFSTISRHDLPAGAAVTTSYAQTQTYRDASGRQDVNSGFLPPGFLAIDLAHQLQLPLFDPDDMVANTDQTKSYKKVDPTLAKPSEQVAQRPKFGNGLIGGTGSTAQTGDAQVIVAANGGSDLVYIPSQDAALARQIVAFLTTQDYVSGLFVDDRLGDIPGTLPMSTINLVGSTSLPKPSIVVNFRSFAMDPAAPAQTQVIVADTSLQQGQGMHGSFGRGDTFNNMVAFGADFKQTYVDQSPVSNADVAVTLAHVLGFAMPSKGQLQGRVLVEALAGGPVDLPFERKTIRSQTAADNGMVTLLDMQSVGDTHYFDAAGFPGRTAGLSQ